MALLREVAGELSAGNYESAVQIACLPELVSGFGHVKERNVGLMQKRRNELLGAFRKTSAEPAMTGT